MPDNRRECVEPAVLAAITAVLAAYGFSPGQGYRIASIREESNAWKKAGILENMHRL